MDRILRTSATQLAGGISSRPTCIPKSVAGSVLLQPVTPKKETDCEVVQSGQGGVTNGDTPVYRWLEGPDLTRTGMIVRAVFAVLKKCLDGNVILGVSLP